MQNMAQKVSELMKRSRTHVTSEATCCYIAQTYLLHECSTLHAQQAASVYSTSCHLACKSKLEYGLVKRELTMHLIGCMSHQLGSTQWACNMQDQAVRLANYDGAVVTEIDGL